MRNWFKNYIKKHKLLQNNQNSGRLGKYLRSSHVWEVKKNSVARGVAVGLFVGIIPALPFQTLLTISIAILLRANLPAALLVSWISNPLTLLPIAYFTYLVGNWVLGNDSAPIIFTDISLQDNLREVSVPFFVGLPIVSLGAALLGYLLVIIIWSSSEYLSKRNKKNNF
ncbi:MAG: DUF2062 domain-containing protein [Gammaproteobacteria bacterium]|nr:DUF2062 domain-containing protein [Gammaproteobacteria bacterium]